MLKIKLFINILNLLIIFKAYAIGQWKVFEYSGVFSVGSLWRFIWILSNWIIYIYKIFFKKSLFPLGFLSTLNIIMTSHLWNISLTTPAGQSQIHKLSLFTLQFTARVRKPRTKKYIQPYQLIWSDELQDKYWYFSNQPAAKETEILELQNKLTRISYNYLF